MSLLLAIVAAENTAETVAVTSGAAGRRRNRTRRPPVQIRGRYYDPDTEAFAIAEALREWVAEIEARDAPQANEPEQKYEPELVSVETSGGVVNLPVFAPMYRAGEVEQLIADLMAIEARKSELMAWAEGMRRQQEDEDDVEMLLLH